MSKFNVGDTIKPKEFAQGFVDVKIQGIDSQYYYLEILNGIASVPIKTVENNYQLSKKK